MKTIAQQLKIKHFPFTIKNKNGKEMYYEASDGYIKDNRPKIVELTLQQIADKMGIKVEQLRIKD